VCNRRLEGRHFTKVKQDIEMKEGAGRASFAKSGPIDRFLDKMNSGASIFGQSERRRND